MNEFIQTFMVLLMVLWSLCLIIKRYRPTNFVNQQLRFANYCQQHQWIALANWLRPIVVKTSCDSGCGGCAKTCSGVQTNEQLVKFVDKR